MQDLHYEDEASNLGRTETFILNIFNFQTLTCNIQFKNRSYDIVKIKE